MFSKTSSAVRLSSSTKLLKLFKPLIRPFALRSQNVQSLALLVCIAIYLNELKKL